MSLLGGKGFYCLRTRFKKFLEVERNEKVRNHRIHAAVRSPAVRVLRETAPGASDPAAPSKSAEASASPEKTSYKIGAIQYATHPSLDNCYKGFVLGLEEEGLKEGENLTIEFQNAQGESANADLQAKNMITSGYDLLCGVATPAAMSCYSAAKESGTPVIFCAVSDPVSAGIVSSLEKARLRRHRHSG